MEILNNSFKSYDRKREKNEIKRWGAEENLCEVEKNLKIFKFYCKLANREQYVEFF